MGSVEEGASNEVDCPFKTSVYKIRVGTRVVTVVWEEDTLSLASRGELVVFHCPEIKTIIGIIQDAMRMGWSKTQTVNEIQRTLHIRRQRAFWVFNAFLTDDFAERGGIPIMEVHFTPVLARSDRSGRQYACIDDYELYFPQCACQEVMEALYSVKPPSDVAILSLVHGDYYSPEYDVDVAIDLLKDSNADLWELCLDAYQCISNYYEEVRELVKRNEGC